MNILKNEINQGILTICVSVEKEEFHRFLENAYLDHADIYHVSGYAYGLVPRDKLEEVYGTKVLYNEALSLCTAEIYGEFIKKQQIRILGQPQINELHWQEEGGVIFTMTSELYPKITLGQYKGITTMYRQEDDLENFTSDILKKAISHMTVIIPESLIQQRLDYCISEEFYRAYKEKKCKLSLDEYLNSINMTQEQWKEKRREQVYEMTQLELLLNEVASKENLHVFTEEIEQEYYAIANQNDIEIEEAIATYDINLVKEELLRQKAHDCIIDHAASL